MASEEGHFPSIHLETDIAQRFKTTRVTLTEIMALFRRFQSVGVTVLIATHDISLINRMQLRIMRLEDGELTEDGGG